MAGLFKHSRRQSPIDNYLHIDQGLIPILYVDNACILSYNKCQILSEITSLQNDYNLAYEGPLQDYLGTQVDCNKYGLLTLT